MVLPDADDNMFSSPSVRRMVRLRRYASPTRMPQTCTMSPAVCGYMRYISPSSAQLAHLLGIVTPSNDELDVSSANRIVLRAKFTPLLPMTQLFLYDSGIPR